MPVFLWFAVSTIFWASSYGCSQAREKSADKEHPVKIQSDTIKPAAWLPEKYMGYLEGKRVGLIANQTARVGEQHLLDFLTIRGIKVTKIFSPEHGFRGNIERGKHFNPTVDKKTGIPIVAMYGNNRKPKAAQLADIDILVFDIQDVGVRFYTYISSMHLGMEAAAENNVEFMVLDRPNPLGDYVAGPVLDLKYRSFAGMHPIPVVHGLTVGELALMINGEGWLKDNISCDLKVIKCLNYGHKDFWSLKVKPSPNLPNDLAIRLYPSLCFFEATEVSIGRGTEFPFQVVGYPDSTFGEFSFTPRDIEQMQTNPVQEGKTCYGLDFRSNNHDSYFTMQYVVFFNKLLKAKNKPLITNVHWFNLLAGNNKLLKKITGGMTAEEIEQSWQKELSEYKVMRKQYLLYPDFE